MTLQDWVSNSFQEGPSPNLPVCIIGMAISCLIVIRVVGFNKSVKYNNIRVVIICSCCFLFLSLFLCLIDDINPNPTKNAIVRNVLALFLCSGLLQLCDEYILYLRAQASVTVTRRTKTLIYCALWTDFLVLWAPSFTIVPFLANTNSPKFAAFYSINRTLHIAVKLFYNTIFAALYLKLYRAIEADKGCAAASRQAWSTVIYNLSYNDGKMSDNKQIILVKSLLYCAFSSIGCIIWLVFDEMPGLAIYEILIVVSQYFLHGSEFSSTINGVFRIWQKKSTIIMFARRRSKHSHYGPMYENALVGEEKDLYEYGRLRSPYPSSDEGVSFHIPEMYVNTLSLNTQMSPRIPSNSHISPGKNTPTKTLSTLKSIGSTLHQMISSRNGPFLSLGSNRENSGRLSPSASDGGESIAGSPRKNIRVAGGSGSASPHGNNTSSSTAISIYQKDDEFSKNENNRRIKPIHADRPRRFSANSIGSGTVSLNESNIEADHNPGEPVIPSFLGMLGKKQSGLTQRDVAAAVSPNPNSEWSNKSVGSEAKVVVTNDESSSAHNIPSMIAHWQTQPSSSKSSLHEQQGSKKDPENQDSSKHRPLDHSNMSAGSSSRRNMEPLSPAMAYIKAMSGKVASARFSRKGLEQANSALIRPNNGDAMEEYDSDDRAQNFYMASRRRNSFAVSSFAEPLEGISSFAGHGVQDLSRPLSQHKIVPFSRRRTTDLLSLTESSPLEQQAS